MKKFLLFVLTMLFVLPVFSQVLYSATTETASRYNPGWNSLNHPKVAFDDVLIPSANVSGRDSIRVTKVKVGIRRLANAPATNVSIYYTIYDDTSTMYNDLIKIPPVLLGTVSLPANGAAAVTEIVSVGDSVNTLFRLKADTGNIYTGYYAFFIGASLSDSSDNQGIRVATGPPNDNAFWVYNADSTVPRYATQFQGGSPNAQFYIEVFGKPGGAFPVTISSFTGEKEGYRNILRWTTATESNNKGFELQRSADGRNFSPVGFVESKAANGNSSSSVSYTFLDEKPLHGTNYYRLKQIDNDGKAAYTSVVTLKGDAKDLQIAAVYPNPARENINLAVSSPNAGKATIKVIDMNGKTVATVSTALVAGDNSVQVKTAALNAGSYYIKLITSDGVVKTVQFVKN